MAAINPFSLLRSPLTLRALATIRASKTGIFNPPTESLFHNPLHFRRSLMVLASKSQKDEANSSDPVAFTSQEDDDLKYLLKLGGGSVLGAAAIKYGSVLFPEITRPNILQALFMISAPVILSVILLIKKSRVD